MLHRDRMGLSREKSLMNAIDRFTVPVRTALAAASLAAAASAGCSKSQAAAPAAEPPTVAVARAQRGDLAETLTLAAEFRPFQEIDVHAKVAGYLKAIYVDVGDRA